MSRNAFKYELIFKDGIRYLSPDVRRKDPGWASEFSAKPIEELKFFLPDGKTIKMRGYEMYNFFVECSENLGGGKCRLEAMYLCGAIKGIVILWKIDLMNKRLIKMRARLGEEYAGTPTRGWRPGLFGERPQTAVVVEN